MSLTNVTVYFAGGSSTGTSMQGVVRRSLPESFARRVIAKNLKIVTGTITWAASGFPGSAGESFQYKMFGDRFLWMGFTPRLATTAATHAEVGFLPIYDPSSGGKIYMCGTTCYGSTVGNNTKDGMGFSIVDKGTRPAAQYTVGFCLMVVENTAGSGIGV